MQFTEEMMRTVRAQRLGYVATVCPDGTPNLSPKGTVPIWDNEHLVFADIQSPRTIANLRLNPSVEVNVVDPFLRKGYRFKGTAEIHTDGSIFERVLSFYGTEIRDARERVRSVVLVKVERASALISPTYDSGISEREITEKWKAYYTSLQSGIIPEQSPD